MDTKNIAIEAGTFFKVYCPGQYKTSTQKLTMYNNGSVSNNIRYQDICNPEYFVINVAYITTWGWFEVYNNTMYEWYDYWGLTHDETNIPYDWEILKKFFHNNNIVINYWLDNNGTWGTANYETGKWTGLTGQVNKY